MNMQDDSYELIPENKNMKPFEIAIIFSGLERSLAGSKYNMRVDECRSSAYALKAFAGMEYGKYEDTYLYQVPEEVFYKYKDKLPENWRKRAEHFYSEQQRVQAGAEAWRKGDIEEFGRIIFESGRSSIENYETGSDELKKLYEILLDTEGIYGGRFSGAGFKGCAMAIVNPDYKEKIEYEVTKKYLKEFPQLEGKFGVYFAKSTLAKNKLS